MATSLTRVFRVLVVVTLLAGVQRAGAGADFPGAEWEWFSSPGEAGYCPDRLEEVRRASEEVGSAAVMIIHQGRVVAAWGDLERKFESHSLRKSFLSALYGIQSARGKIDLEATLADLRINDHDPLSEVEKQATVRMLLQARSGIFHPALYETVGMAAARPARHAHRPGTHFYYNNWDFNALGTIYEQETGEKIHASFEEHIGRPIGMQDFTAADGRYVTGQDSVHPAYPFLMSARDLARFGLLFLRDGMWQGSRVLPEGWVAESTTSYSDAGGRGGYGYMWWIAAEDRHFAGVTGLPDGLYTGRGAGGHVLAIVPSHDLVFVHRANTFAGGRRVAYADVGRLLQGVIEASKEAMDRTERRLTSPSTNTDE
jgi:CubicO group peptidase (beta-lactamase class C family)